jgi:hypothetical protein
MYEFNESYAAGWDWAGDALTWMSVDQVEDLVESAAADLGEAAGDPEMAHEGIMDRLEIYNRAIFAQRV